VLELEDVLAAGAGLVETDIGRAMLERPGRCLQALDLFAAARDLRGAVRRRSGMKSLSWAIFFSRWAFCDSSVSESASWHHHVVVAPV